MRAGRRGRRPHRGAARPLVKSSQMDPRCRHSRSPRMRRVRGRPLRRSSWHGSQPRSRPAGDRRRAQACSSPRWRVRRLHVANSRSRLELRPAPRQSTRHRTEAICLPSRSRVCYSSRCSTSTSSTARRACLVRRMAARCARRPWQARQRRTC